MSTPFVLALGIAAVALVALLALVLRAVVVVRRFRAFAALSQRLLADDSAVLQQRQAALTSEINRRRGRA